MAYRRKSATQQWRNDMKRRIKNEHEDLSETELGSEITRLEEVRSELYEPEREQKQILDRRKTWRDMKESIRRLTLKRDRAKGLSERNGFIARVMIADRIEESKIRLPNLETELREELSALRSFEVESRKSGIELEKDSGYPYSEYWEKHIAERKKAAFTKTALQELQRERRTETTKAMARAHTGNTRELASTVKNQLELSPECPYCEDPLGDDPECDHIHPVSKGGLSIPENMVFVCKSCNRLKGRKKLIAFADETNLDLGEIVERLKALGKDP